MDSAALEPCLPQRKLVELRELLYQWQGRRSCSKQELESQTGKLAHASKVVQSGRTFMYRTFELKICSLSHSLNESF